ncbi:unnamed protein product, partial [Iphiclides podalirius]
MRARREVETICVLPNVQGHTLVGDDERIISPAPPQALPGGHEQRDGPLRGEPDLVLCARRLYQADTNNVMARYAVNRISFYARVGAVETICVLPKVQGHTLVGDDAAV